MKRKEEREKKKHRGQSQSEGEGVSLSRNPPLLLLGAKSMVDDLPPASCLFSNLLIIDSFGGRGRSCRSEEEREARPVDVLPISLSSFNICLSMYEKETKWKKPAREREALDESLSNHPPERHAD